LLPHYFFAAILAVLFTIFLTMLSMTYPGDGVYFFFTWDQCLERGKKLEEELARIEELSINKQIRALKEKHDLEK